MSANRTAITDVYRLPAGRMTTADEQMHVRVMNALMSVAPVYEGRACLTRIGSRYFGLHWHPRPHVGGYYWS